MHPETYEQAIEFFSDAENCRAYILSQRWPDGIVRCPQCGSDRVLFLKKYSRWKCSNDHDRRQFTLKTGTAFQHSQIGLDKWFLALWIVVTAKGTISSYEVAKKLGVTQKSAWFMLCRLRRALE